MEFFKSPASHPSLDELHAQLHGLPLAQLYQLLEKIYTETLPCLLQSYEEEVYTSLSFVFQRHLGMMIPPWSIFCSQAAYKKLYQRYTQKLVELAPFLSFLFAQERHVRQQILSLVFQSVIDEYHVISLSHGIAVLDSIPGIVYREFPYYKDKQLFSTVIQALNEKRMI